MKLGTITVAIETKCLTCGKTIRAGALKSLKRKCKRHYWLHHGWLKWLKGKFR